MNVGEQVLAGLALLACAVLAVRLAIGERRRPRFDRAVVNAWRRSSQAVRRLVRLRSSRREAARVAEEAIRRAQGGSWRGNVYTPKSFRKPKKPH